MKKAFWALVLGLVAASAIVMDRAYATDTLYFSPSGKSGPAGTNVEMIVKLDTEREVGAIVIFVEHDGDTDFVSAVQGSTVSGWDIDVYEDIEDYPNSAWILLIGNGTEYVTGSGQQVAKLTFTLGGCGTNSPITWVADDCEFKSYLSTVQLETINPTTLTSCAGDETLTFGNGTVTATVPPCGCVCEMKQFGDDSPVDSKTWTATKQLYR